MNIELLKEKYGKNKKRKQLLNAVLREEIAGGDQTLELLELVHKVRTSKRLGANASEFLEEVEDRLQSIRDELILEIEKKYPKD